MKWLATFLVLGTIALAAPDVSADCRKNPDWPDAPCMDQTANGRYVQDDVDRWADYYDWRGSETMEKKRLEMLDAI